MVRCAIQNIEGFELSDIEFESENISYTYLTIKELYKRYNIEGKIGFIIGTDAFYHLLDWYETDKLKELVEFILFKRSDTIDENRLALLSKKGYKFNITDMEFLDISSTMVREKIARGESVENLVSQSVLEYIEKNELYRK